MKSPKFCDLPNHQSEKTAWPWRSDSKRLPDLMSDGRPWPKISIITPSYNQGCFLEETIRSVLLQGYPNYEYIIIDGGSSDNSISILKTYSQFITKWISEPDQGQSDAINKGFKCATGEILAWINSDDLYEQDVFSRIALSFVQNPDIRMIYGDCEFINESSQMLYLYKSKDFSLQNLVNDSYIPQPSVFFKKEIFGIIGFLDGSLHYAMDYEYWIRIGLHFKIQYIPVTLSKFRLHPESKTISRNDLFIIDILHLYEKFIKSHSLSLEQFDMIVSELIWKILKIENFSNFKLLFSNRGDDTTIYDEFYSRIFALNNQNIENTICKHSFEKEIKCAYKYFFINFYDSVITDNELDSVTNHWYESQNLKIMGYSKFLFKRKRFFASTSIILSFIIWHMGALLNRNFVTSLCYAIRRKLI